MADLILLVDYKNHFGSKHDAIPYRSGMDKDMLYTFFRSLGHNVKFKQFNDVTPSDSEWRGAKVLYTSSEDNGLVYKQYIEDVILALTDIGADIIPSYRYLRANNNKVYMELLRQVIKGSNITDLKCMHFGCLEELLTSKKEIIFPVVVKGSAGAMGKNVFLARDLKELINVVKKRITPNPSLWFRFKEKGRIIKHQGYLPDSRYIGKFVLQEFIPDLKNDWKVYYFGDKAFVFYRPVFAKRIFKASGGGYDNYSYGNKANIPAGLLDFGWEMFLRLNVPNASFDIAWNIKSFYLLEFQCLYFGTAGILKRYSSEYFQKTKDGWIDIPNKEGIVEKIYAESIDYYLGNRV